MILLLKGHRTIVTNGKEGYIVEKGCPGMATAGSGDVLSGILTGILGYNKPSILSVAAGAYLAGLAGEIAQNKLNDISMKASDTIANIPEAINKIREWDKEGRSIFSHFSFIKKWEKMLRPFLSRFKLIYKILFYLSLRLHIRL